MKTSTLIVGVVALAAIGGIAYFAVKRSGTLSTVTTPTTGAQPPKSTTDQLINAGTRLGVDLLDRLFDRVADAPADL